MESVGSLGVSGQWTRMIRSSNFHTFARYPETQTIYRIVQHNKCCRQNAPVIVLS